MYVYTCIEKLRQLVSFYGGGAKCWNITNIRSWVGWCMGQSVWKQIESKKMVLFTVECKVQCTQVNIDTQQNEESEFSIYVRRNICMPWPWQ